MDFKSRAQSRHNEEACLIVLELVFVLGSFHLFLKGTEAGAWMQGATASDSWPLSDPRVFQAWKIKRPDATLERGVVKMVAATDVCNV